MPYFMYVPYETTVIDILKLKIYQKLGKVTRKPYFESLLPTSFLASIFITRKKNHKPF